MAEVTVPVEAAVAGQFPPVCAISGRPSDTRARRRGPGGLVVVLPYRREKLRRLRHRLGLQVACLVGPMVAYIGDAVLNQRIWGLVFGLALSAGTLINALKDRPRVTTDDTGGWVTLSRVHPRFAAAVESRVLASAAEVTAP